MEDVFKFCGLFRIYELCYIEGENENKIKCFYRSYLNPFFWLGPDHKSQNVTHAPFYQRKAQNTRILSKFDRLRSENKPVVLVLFVSAVNSNYENLVVLLGHVKRFLEKLEFNDFTTLF